MNDQECVHFLQWSLPRLGLRWPGFRRVRKQVYKRLRRRLQELGLTGLTDYRNFLEQNPLEWKILDSLCRITISRFYRDRQVFADLSAKILPALTRDTLKSSDKEIRCWSAGCCSGEEPYTLQIIWQLLISPALAPDLGLKIFATTTGTELITRAEKGVYPASSLQSLPQEFIARAFIRENNLYRLKPAFTEGVEFIEQDIRNNMPAGLFHLILCRNLVLTYFEETIQLKIMQKIIDRLRPGGVLVIGRHENLPKGLTGLTAIPGLPCIFRKPD